MLSRHCISFWRYGDHDWMAYSRCGLTHVSYIIRKSSQSSLLKFLVTIASMERALAAALVHWTEGFKLSVIKMPRSFSSLTVLDIMWLQPIKKVTVVHRCFLAAAASDISLKISLLCALKFLNFADIFALFVAFVVIMVVIFELLHYSVHILQPYSLWFDAVGWCVKVFIYHCWKSV